MNKRPAAAVLAAITAAAMLTACGARKPKTDTEADAANAAQTASEAGVVAAGSGAGTVPADTGTEETAIEAETEPGGETADSPVPFLPKADEGEEKSPVKDDRNAVLVDNDECRVTVTGCGGSREDGYEVKLLLENKNRMKDCLFAVERAYLDSVRFDTYFSVTAAPGKSKEGCIYFSADEMGVYGIESPADIALYMSAIDPDYYDRDYIDETCHIYPGGYGAASSYNYTVKDGDRVLAENENAAVILTGFSKDSELDYYCADLCLVNKTKEVLLFAAEDVEVNGESLNPFFSHTLDGGCTSFTRAIWPEEDMEYLEPGRPESIKATFTAETESGGEEKLKQECVLMP